MFVIRSCQSLMRCAGKLQQCDADLNASKMVLTAPADAVGIGPDTTFEYHVAVADNYFTGAVTDDAGPFTVTGSAPKYATPDTQLSAPAAGSETATVTATATGTTASPTQLGVLALYPSTKAKGSATAIIISP
ncbi:MAG: hypothetical protein ABIR32_23350 [Ilumatobacteraceae bacterium]